LTSFIRKESEVGFERPLNFAIFGEPGAGKTFAFKEIIKTLGLPHLAPTPLEFNLSQFESETDLNDAFRQIASVCLQNLVPVVFWDEYDSNKGEKAFGWLQGFLEPMSDRKHSSGHIGRSVFVFAGSRFKSTSDLMLADLYSEFDLLDDETKDLLSGYKTDVSKDLPQEELDVRTNKLIDDLSSSKPGIAKSLPQFIRLNAAIAPSQSKLLKYGQFSDAKGRDFKSRLTKCLDLTGVNQGQSRPEDHTYLIKRAMIANFEFRKRFSTLVDHSKALNLSSQVVESILSNTHYTHGARSLSTIVSSMTAHGKNKAETSMLPSDSMLRMHVSDVEEFERFRRHSSL